MPNDMQSALDDEEGDRMYLIAFGAVGISGALIGLAVGAWLALWWMC